MTAPDDIELPALPEMRHLEGFHEYAKRFARLAVTAERERMREDLRDGALWRTWNGIASDPEFSCDMNAGGWIFIRGVIDTAIARESASACDHQWTDMRNSVIESGEWCPKCGLLRDSGEKTEGDRG